MTTPPASPGLSARRRLLIPLPLALTLLAGAALGPASPAEAATTGSGRAATEARTVAPFEAVAVRDSIDVEVRQAAAASVTVTADDNLLPLLETVVEGGTLQLRFRRGESVRTRTPPKVVIEVERLRAVSSAGSGQVSVHGLRTTGFKLAMAGSGDAVLAQLQAESLELSLAGSGDVRGDGTARAVKIGIAGSGDVDLGGLESDEVEVSIAGSGDASVTANKALRASIAGSGDVRYRGRVTQVHTSVVGSGRVVRR